MLPGRRQTSRSTRSLSFCPKASVLRRWRRDKKTLRETETILEETIDELPKPAPEQEEIKLNEDIKEPGRYISKDGRIYLQFRCSNAVDRDDGAMYYIDDYTVEVQQFYEYPKEREGMALIVK